MGCLHGYAGVFAVGEVADGRYRQTATAVGDGCRAAIDAWKWLEGRDRAASGYVERPPCLPCGGNLYLESTPGIHLAGRFHRGYRGQIRHYSEPISL